MSFNFPSNYYQIDSFNNNKITKNEHDLREIIYELKDRILELEQENKIKNIRINKNKKRIHRIRKIQSVFSRRINIKRKNNFRTKISFIKGTTR